MRKLLFSLFLLVVGITILIPALVIMLLAVSLIVIADELLTREIEHNKMEDGVTFETLNDHSEEPSAVADESDRVDAQTLRSKLIMLAEKCEIKHSVAHIKKASHSALEKIKGEYERKQLEKTNEYLTETLMGKLSEFMEGVNMIDNAKSMEEELVHNKMVKRDLKNILGYVTPYIPLIGLVCGASIVGKHMYNRKTEEPTEE